MAHNVNKCLGWIAAAMTAAGLFSSCGMMTDDRDDCPVGLYVGFKYDYNTQRADMFKDQVGGVTLYVFDENGKLVTQREVTNAKDADALRSAGYKMNFTDLPDGKYHLYAMAMQKGYDEALKTKGAKYRRTELKVGDPKENINVKLDRAEKKDNIGIFNVKNDSLPLDTLWMSMGETTAEAVTDEPTYAMVPLIRDTKRLTLTIRQMENPVDISWKDFDISIVDRNGKIAFDNSVTADDTLRYTPFAKWDTQEETGTNGEKRNVVHAEINFNRLIDHADYKEDARLVVKNKKGIPVLDINLPDYLAQGRGAFENQTWGNQEYLDRQPDYYLDLILNGGKWMYIDVRVLSWTSRNQISNL